MERLLRLMQAGDLDALDTLVRTSGDRLLAVARRRCRCHDDAEDAVQQALLTASRAMTGFRGEGSPLAWLQTLVARTCYRMNERREHDDDGGSVDDVPCGCDDAEVVAARHQLGTRLGDALMLLPRVDRLAFVLAAEGFSGREIAQRFALSEDAVRSRLKRARKILRAALRDVVDDDEIADTEFGAVGTSGQPGADHAHND